MINCFNRGSFHYDLTTQNSTNYKVNEDLRKMYDSMAIGLNIT